LNANVSIEAVAGCACLRCLRLRDERIRGLPVELTRMILCPGCGSKRCPHATDHRQVCTNSNEPGQVGSIYGTPPADLPPIPPIAQLPGPAEVYSAAPEQAVDLLSALSRTGPAERPAPPVDMVLHCPACRMQHIDRDNSQELRIEAAQRGFICGSADWEAFIEQRKWTNPPHRSHLCAGCKHVWRPSDVATNGVAAVASAGKHDSPIAQPIRGMDPSKGLDTATALGNLMMALSTWKATSAHTAPPAWRALVQACREMVQADAASGHAGEHHASS